MRPPLARTATLATIVLLASSAHAALVERSSGVGFLERPTVEGTEFECLGTAERRVFLFSAYAMAFCVDHARVESLVGEPVRRAHGDKSGEALKEAILGDGAFFRGLALAPADRLVVMHALRDLSRERIGAAFRESLGGVLPEAKVQLVMDAIPADAPEGSVVRIWSRGSQVTIDVGGRMKTIDDADVARELWRMWLGPKSVTPELRESIAEHVAGTPSRE